MRIFFLLILFLCITMKSSGQQNQMINFNVSVTNIDGVPQVQLTWQATEYCSCYFTIERGSNAQNNFIPLNTIWGFGDSYPNYKSYLFMDFGPFSNCATYCYRVRLDTSDCPSPTCYFNSYTDTICVKSPIGELYLPNAFSPNGDGENDLLQLYYCKMQDITTFELTVYNRFGEKVFETTNPGFQWNGSYHGTIMNSQVFVYYLQAALKNGRDYSGDAVNDTKIFKKGNISLFK